MKFKKNIVFLLTFLILISNIGLSFNIHYCGNELESITLKNNILNDNFNEKDCCGTMEKDSKCCHNKVVVFQKKSDFSSVKTFGSENLYFIPNPNFKSIFFVPKTNYKNISNSSFYCNNHAPPLYKLHSQFIFYG